MRAIVLGHKYTAEEAKAAGLTEDCCNPKDLVDRAKNLAVTLSQDRPDRHTLSLIKTDLFHELHMSLMQPIRMHSRL